MANIVFDNGYSLHRKNWTAKSNGQICPELYRSIGESKLDMAIIAIPKACESLLCTHFVVQVFKINSVLKEGNYS